MDPDLISTLNISFIIALCACALFSFLETSITALRLFKLKELAQKNPKYHDFFVQLEKKPQNVLTTIIIANCLSNVIAAATSTTIMEYLLAKINFEGLGFSLGIGLATVAILIFGEIIPKNLAKSKGEKLLRSSLWIANFIFKIFRPFIPLLHKLSSYFIYMIGGKKALEDTNDWIASEKEIQFLIEHINEKGLMETEKTAMLQNIFELGKTPVKEVMIPSTDIISIDINTPINNVIKTFSKYQYTRLPVYENKIDNIIGMLHLKDVFILWTQKKDKPLKEVIRTISFVPESLKINQLLRQLQEQHQHIAIVINEYGSITGLVTLEDILEEIVGEISDEYESAEKKVVKLKQGGWLVHATTSLDELEDILNITFETEDALTLGGFLIEKAQHLPKKGERISYKNYYFQIQKASIKRVLQVLIFKDSSALKEK